MKMSELILAVGDDNVKFQNLLQGDIDLAMTKRGTKVTFYTDGITPADVMDKAGCKVVGLVLWLPRDKVDAAISKARP